jgi:hypothetical protein
MQAIAAFSPLSAHRLLRCDKNLGEMLEISDWKLKAV